MSSNTPIYDLQSLLREKELLKLKIEQKERELADTGRYFQRNYKRIIWQYINPFEGNTAMGQIVNVVKSAVLPLLVTLDPDDEEIGKISGNQSIAGIAAVLAVRLVKRIFKKKNKEKEG